MCSRFFSSFSRAPRDQAGGSPADAVPGVVLRTSASTAPRTPASIWCGGVATLAGRAVFRWGLNTGSRKRVLARNERERIEGFVSHVAQV